MEKSLADRKEIKYDNLSDDARASAGAGYDTENQLSNSLITIILAFVALISLAVSSAEVLGMLTFAQKLIVFISLILFTGSIFAGLINYFANIRFHQKIAELNRSAARRAERASNSAELKAADIPESAMQPRDAVPRNNVFLLIQITLMLAGLVLTVVFVGLLLFQTSEEVPDIEDALPY